MAKRASPAALQVGVHEAKSRLSELLRLVASGQEVEILRGGVPVARLVPHRAQDDHRTLGADHGVFSVPEDFDAPLPSDVLDSFYR